MWWMKHPQMHHIRKKDYSPLYLISLTSFVSALVAWEAGTASTNLITSVTVVSNNNFSGIAHFSQLVSCNRLIFSTTSHVDFFHSIPLVALFPMHNQHQCRMSAFMKYLRHETSNGSESVFSNSTVKLSWDVVHSHSTSMTSPRKLTTTNQYFHVFEVILCERSCRTGE